MNERSLAQLVDWYAQAAADELDRRLAVRLEHAPRCPITRYLLGCQGFDAGRCPQAVRHMMIAHHEQPDLESAALLVFAGLNWISRRGSTLLEVLIDTWDEFRRPDFDRCRGERRVLDAFAGPAPAPLRVSPLARRLWRLPIQTLRAQILASAVDGDAGVSRLAVAPT